MHVEHQSPFPDTAAAPNGFADAFDPIGRLAAVQAEVARLAEEVGRLECRHRGDVGSLEGMTEALSALRRGYVAMRAENAELRSALDHPERGRRRQAARPADAQRPAAADAWA